MYVIYIYIHTHTYHMSHPTRTPARWQARARARPCASRSALFGPEGCRSVAKLLDQATTK